MKAKHRKKQSQSLSKEYSSYERKINNYFEKHPTYNSFLHAIGGIGLGLMIANLIGASYLLFWGIILLGIYVTGHIYAHNKKK